MTNEYIYNGDGVRVAQISNGERTDYVQDVASPLPQVMTARNGDTTTRYLRGLGLIGEQQAGGAFRFHLPDALGSVRQITDPTGQVLLSQRFDPFGGLQTAKGAATSNFGFAGEEQDPASGQVYLRARTYNPATGRFLQQDPVLGTPNQPRTLHNYAYAFNNPVNYVDPSGQKPPGFGATAYHRANVRQYRRISQQASDYAQALAAWNSNAGTRWPSAKFSKIAQTQRNFLAWPDRGFNPGRTANQIAKMVRPTLDAYARHQSEGHRPRSCGFMDFVNGFANSAKNGTLLKEAASIAMNSPAELRAGIANMIAKMGTIEDVVTTIILSQMYAKTFIGNYLADGIGDLMNGEDWNVNTWAVWAETKQELAPMYSKTKEVVTDIGVPRLIMGTAIIAGAIVMTGGAAIPAILAGAVIGGGIGYGMQVYNNFEQHEGQGFWQNFWTNITTGENYTENISPLPIITGAFMGAVSGAVSAAIAPALPGGGTGIGGIAKTAFAELAIGRVTQVVTNVVSGAPWYQDLGNRWMIAMDVLPGVAVATFRSVRASGKAAHSLGAADDVAVGGSSAARSAEDAVSFGKPRSGFKGRVRDSFDTIRDRFSSFKNRYFPDATHQRLQNLDEFGSGGSGKPRPDLSQSQGPIGRRLRGDSGSLPSNSESAPLSQRIKAANAHRTNGADLNDPNVRAMINKGRGPVRGKIEMITDPETGHTLPKEYVEAIETLGISRREIFDLYHQDYKAGVDFETFIDDYVANNPYGVNHLDAHVIYGYTTKFFYERLNALLREGKNAAQTAPIEKLLNNAVQKMPIISGTHYRGINLPDEILEKFLRQHASGDPVPYGDFISAANNKQKWWEKSNVRITIEPKNARDISDLAFGVNFQDKVGKGPNYPQESLIMSGSEFEVDDIIPEVVDGRTIHNIWLTQTK